MICRTGGTDINELLKKLPPNQPSPGKPPPVWANGTLPPADCGKVCPVEMGRELKAAAAARCRWLGSVLGTDIYAYQSFPSCYTSSVVITTLSGGIWLGSSQGALADAGGNRFSRSAAETITRRRLRRVSRRGQKLAPAASPPSASVLA